MESSSGEYSGGEPVLKKLGAEDAKRAVSAFMEAEEKIHQRTTQRTMGTGSVKITNKEGQRRDFMLEFQSEANKKLLAALSAFRK